MSSNVVKWHNNRNSQFNASVKKNAKKTKEREKNELKSANKHYSNLIRNGNHRNDSSINNRMPKIGNWKRRLHFIFLFKLFLEEKKRLFADHIFFVHWNLSSFLSCSHFYQQWNNDPWKTKFKRNINKNKWLSKNLYTIKSKSIFRIFFFFFSSLNSTY